jgi:hypothetical protein
VQYSRIPRVTLLRRYGAKDYCVPETSGFYWGWNPKASWKFGNSLVPQAVSDDFRSKWHYRTPRVWVIFYIVAIHFGRGHTCTKTLCCSLVYSVLEVCVCMLVLNEN